jgi:hypothetical protein
MSYRQVTTIQSMAVAENGILFPLILERYCSSDVCYIVNCSYSILYLWPVHEWVTTIHYKLYDQECIDCCS